MRASPSASLRHLPGLLGGALALLLVAPCPVSAGDEPVVGTVFVRTALGDFVVDLEEDHSVVGEYALAFANLVRDRVFFHESDKQIGCDPDGDGEPDDENCFACVCNTDSATEQDCLGNPIGFCEGDPNERSCTESGFLLTDPLVPSRVLHAGRFQLDDDNGLQDVNGTLDVADPGRAGIFANNPFTVAFVRDPDTGMLTNEWIINLADNSDLVRPDGFTFDDAANGAANAYMVIGTASDATGVLTRLSELATSDARCNCSLNPPDGVAVPPLACGIDPGVPNTPPAILEELDQLPVVDPTRLPDPDAPEPPDLDEPYLIELCDPAEMNDRVCRMPLCETLSDNGFECVQPLCYSVTLLETPEEISPGVETDYACDFPETPNFPIVELAEPAGLLLVNNGLAPPEPTNVADFANNPQLTVDVRDQGCGSVEDPLASCNIAGIATYFEVATGGSLSTLRIGDTSRLLVSGGEITLGLEPYGSSRGVLQAGSVGPISMSGSADLWLDGSSVSEWALDESSTGLVTGAAPVPFAVDLLGSAFLRVAGSGFAVDGMPETLPASLGQDSGNLTGTLASGESLDVDFTRAGGTEIHLLDASTLAPRSAFVPVGDAGNAADDTGFGAVANDFSMGQTEVTNAEYAAFLAAAALDDPFGLWDTEMEDDPRGGIERSGAQGNYQYAVVSGRGAWPVVFVSRDDAMRYVNWLQNDGPNDPQATTESGVYTFVAGDYDGMGRAPGARFFLPTADEWYKAAYYDPGTQTFFDYPTASDTPPGNPPPTRDLGNAANLFDALGDSDAPLSDVGDYRFSASPNGTLDQAGNVLEWLEDSTSLFGGHWNSTIAQSGAGTPIAVSSPDAEDPFLGFRVPEPSSSALAAAVLATLGAMRSRRRRRLATRRPGRSSAR